MGRLGKFLLTTYEFGSLVMIGGFRTILAGGSGSYPRHAACALGFPTISNAMLRQDPPHRNCASGFLRAKRSMAQESCRAKLPTTQKSCRGYQGSLFVPGTPG
jgi:hypothetical protein